MAQHNRFGNEAEEKALDYLLQKGYTLLEKITATVMQK
jgi:Holliday junction resolvase-like predicted endonuclease